MSHRARDAGIIVGLALGACVVDSAYAQVAPSAVEQSRYGGLLAAAARGDAAQIRILVEQGANPDVRDAHGRTPLHVATYGGHHEAMRVLVAAGASPNALENDRYDIVTIAAVANDVPTMKVALAVGASARNVTSGYDGTALIAAAHLGHAEVVRTLIRAGAPISGGRPSSNPSCSATVVHVTPTPSGR
jgi:ankyrin repeat protein